jgi:UTP--glucose-1-phosphate uridylyltransferase
MTDVTKAVIVAAGVSSRMYPYTKVDSKLMIPIINKPIVQHIIEELSQSGIKEVIIISNHISKIKQFFNKNESLNSLLNRLNQNKLIDQLHHIETMSKIKYLK